MSFERLNIKIVFLHRLTRSLETKKKYAKINIKWYINLKKIFLALLDKNHQWGSLKNEF
jgi:hypothetical protein